MIEEESERQVDTVMVPPNDNFEESSREEDDDNEEEVLKARKLNSKIFKVSETL